jgi:hypothetical protein
MAKSLAAQQIKTVIDALKEGPKNWRDFTTDWKKSTVLRTTGKRIPEKSLSRILKDYLQVWGLVFQDKEEGKWHWILNKQEYENKYAYDLAIEHSKRIMFGESEARDGETYWGIPANINTFECYATGSWKTDNAHVTEFLQHLKTGYPDLFDQLEEFKELYFEREEIIQRTKSKNPEYFQRTWMMFSFPAFLKEQDEALAWNTKFSPGDGPDAYKKAIEKQTAESRTVFSKEDLKRLVELEEKMMSTYQKGGGALIRIEKTVQSETPLKGWCDYCPHKLVKIKSQE